MQANFAADDDDDDGFDPDENPPWFMVGDDKRRDVFLWNGSTMHLHSLDPDVATAKFADESEKTDNRRQVVVHGAGWGSTVIEARLYNLAKARLYVSVYPHKQLRVNFYRVRDKNGDMPIFNTSMVNKLTRQLNAVYEDQANLSFVSHLIHEDVPIDADFATTDQSSDARRKIFGKLRETAQNYDNAPRHYHVFWVKTWGASDWTKRGSANRDVLGEAEDFGSKLCIMEDVHNSHQQGLLLAHELGHCLNAHHDKKRENALMHPTSPDGRKLYRVTVEQIRGKWNGEVAR